MSALTACLQASPREILEALKEHSEERGFLQLSTRLDPKRAWVICPGYQLIAEHKAEDNYRKVIILFYFDNYSPAGLRNKVRCYPATGSQSDFFDVDVYDLRRITTKKLKNQDQVAKS